MPAGAGSFAMKYAPASAVVAIAVSELFATVRGMRFAASAAAIASNRIIDSRPPAHTAVPQRCHSPGAPEILVGRQSPLKHSCAPNGPISRPPTVHQLPTHTEIASKAAEITAIATNGQRD